MDGKRKVEVFTAGCYLCREAERFVKNLPCSDCEVIIYDLRKEGREKAKVYGICAVPTIVVNGKIAECCVRGKINAETLKAAVDGQML